MIRVQNACKYFDSRKILDDINVIFEEGKTNLIIGRSGSGKTVLLKSIVGLITIDTGEIWYDETLFTELKYKGKKQIRQQMGMLFQGSALFDSLTVEENVRFPLDMFSGKSARDISRQVDFCLERVNLKGTNQVLPSELSGGMQKRAAIARAIALNPKYLFCDEPNSGLDPRTAIMIDTLIKELTEEFNMTTIVNTHDMNSVMEIGEKVVFIAEGKLEWEGSSENIFLSGNELLNRFIAANSMARKYMESLKGDI